MNNRRQLARILLPLAIIIGGIWVGTYLLQQQQVIQKEAAPLCPQEATCRWDTSGEGVMYRYEVVDLITGTSVVAGETNELYATFVPFPLHRYECRVRAVNDCGESEESKGAVTCRQTIRLSPTSSASLSATIQPEASVSATPTEIASVSATIVLSPTESVTSETMEPTVIEVPIPDTPTPTVVKPFLVAYSSAITTASRILSFFTFGLVLVAVGMMVYRRKKRS